MVASSEYRVNIIISSKDKTSGEAKKAQKGLEFLKKAAKFAAIAYVGLKVAQEAIKFAKFGGDVQRAAMALDNLAMAAGESGKEIIASIQEASDFTIDRMTAMQVANKAMLMGVAKSPEQFRELAHTATILGRAMGLDAVTAIDRFIVAAGRKSVKVADDLGLLIDATAANEKYAISIGKTVEELDAAEQSQAFLNAMTDAARPKVAALEGETKGLTTRFEALNAALKDAKSILAEEFAIEIDETAQALEDVAGKTIDWQTILRRSVADFIQTNLHLNQIQEGLGDWSEQQRRNNVEIAIANAQWADSAVIFAQYTTAQEETITSTKTLAAEVPKLTAASRLYLAELAEHETLGGAFINTTRNITFAVEKAAVDALAKATHELNVYNAAIKKFSLDAGMRWKSYFDGVDEKAADFETRREQLTAQHQETLEELTKRGQSKAIAIDEAAEWDKLAVLETRLTIAEMKQAEFTDKTRESTRLAKRLAIQQLKEKIAAQSTLLDDWYAGRLRTTGENVNALITEEDRRHKAAIEGLEKEIGKTQELQKQQLGTLMLQTFETWAEIKEIPANEMIKMRTAIAKEYGLISEEEAILVGLSVKTWEGWAKDFGVSADQVVSDLDAQIRMVHNLQMAIEDLPESKVIDFIVNIRREQVYTPEAELRTLDRPVAGGDTYNFNQTVNTQATSHNVVNDFRTAQALVE